MKRRHGHIIRLALVILAAQTLLLAKDPGINAFYKGDYKKAQDYYDARLKKDKDNEKIMYNSGTAALAQKDTLKAESLLRQSLATDDEKQLAKAHYNLGQLALQEQNSEEALVHFMKSMIYDPDDPNSKIMYEHIRQMQQQQQQQQQEKDQESNSKNQDQDKKDQEKKDQDKKQDQQQDQQQGDQQKQDPREDDTPPDQQQKDQQQQDQQQQESQLSEKDLQAQDLTKEQAKNILNAMKEDEKESMKKLILSKANGKRVKRSKEW